MKKVVRLLIISILVLACAIGLVACDNGSSKDEEPGIVCKKLSGDDFYTVTGYNDKDGETSLDISAAVKDKYGDDVVIGRIRKGAFDGNNTLVEVIVSDNAGDGVDVTIDEGAFKNMRALEKITLPFIGANANSDAYFNETAPSENKAVDKERSFGYIFGEEESEYASAMKFSYGDKDDATATFYIPVGLKEVTVYAENEINIPMYAFSGAVRISTVNLSGNIKAIGVAAFKNMASLKEIKIPASVKVIYDSAFEGATALASVTFETGSQLTAIKDSAFKGVIVKEMDISGTQVKTVGNYAFAGNTNLSELTFGTSVKSIGAWVFADCNKLTELTYAGTQAQCNEIKGRVLGLEGSKITKIKCSDGDIDLTNVA